MDAALRVPSVQLPPRLVKEEGGGALQPRRRSVRVFSRVPGEPLRAGRRQGTVQTVHPGRPPAPPQVHHPEAADGSSAALLISPQGRNGHVGFSAGGLEQVALHPGLAAPPQPAQRPTLQAPRRHAVCIQGQKGSAREGVRAGSGFLRKSTEPNSHLPLRPENFFGLACLHTAGSHSTLPGCH